MGQRNVYIVPSGAGLMLGATLLLLLLASVNYQLNLGYLLTFMLAGAAFAGMHLGHRSLRGITLQLQAPSAVFAGSSVALKVQLRNPQALARYGLGLAVHGAARPDWRWADVPAFDTTEVEIRLPAPQRGCHRIPALTIETRYPLGTFRVWSIWRPASRYWVYPQPEAHAPALPAPSRQPHGVAVWVRSGGEELDGIRLYRRGDSLKRLVWKKMGKGRQWLSRDGAGTEPQALWLDFDQCDDRNRRASTEQRLSRLTAWVLQADARGLAYGLRLPGQQWGPAAGAAHRTVCLTALAQWQAGPAA